MPDRPIPNTLEIQAYLHCKLCLEEVQTIADRTKYKQSPATYQRVEVGFTKLGIQVWCRRHNVNIIHLDFQGRKFPYNNSRAEATP